jgi:hypothetical protein
MILTGKWLTKVLDFLLYYTTTFIFGYKRRLIQFYIKKRGVLSVTDRTPVKGLNI